MAYKLIFAIELSTEERMSNFLAAGFLFSVTDKCFSPAFLFRGQIDCLLIVTLQPWVTFFLFWSWSICLFTLCAHCSRLCYLDTILTFFYEKIQVQCMYIVSKLMNKLTFLFFCSVYITS